MRRSVIILIMLLSGTAVFAQTQPSLRGRVICQNDNKPVDMAAVVVKELNIWSMTDENGNYLLKSVPDGNYTLVVTCLGFVQLEKEITFPYKDGALDLVVEQNTLSLDEIVVVAQEGKRMGSGSMIQQSAIQHVQPTDLSDVMQLLPGQITVNPNLSDPKQLTIREIKGTDAMASLGTALVIDGATVSNDANMQFLSTTNVTNDLTEDAGFSSTAAGGVDVRQISVDNIESIEVIRGIGSVETGDALSGTVKVTMKKGQTPFTAKIKIDPGIKQFYAAKGFSLGDQSGTLNIDFDYTKSLDDIRTRYKTFNRLNAGLTWANTLMRDRKPLTVNLSLRGTRTIDLNQKDPDVLDIESYESEESGLTFNLNGKWALNSGLLTNLNYLVSGNFQHQVGHEVENENISGGARPQPISVIAGEFEAPMLPGTYVSDLTIDGRPYYFESRISGNKSFYLGKALNNLNGGIEWKISGNNGEGRMYDMSRPPQGSETSSTRPRSYKSVPGVDQYSVYLEENINIPMGHTKLDLQAGLRYTNLQPDGIFSSERNILMLDPRSNIRYTLVDNKSNTLSKLVLRAGYGLFSKGPTVAMLYPDKSYWDHIAFNYYDPDAYAGLIVVQTALYENTANKNLKAAVNRKIEGGIDLKLHGIDMSFTLFTEEMKNGFAFNKSYHNVVYNNYDDIPSSGKDPYYVSGDGIYYSDRTTGEIFKLPSVKDTVFSCYSMPYNTGMTRKSGVEFTIDFGNIKSLRTSFILDGAYMKVTNQDMADYWSKPGGGNLVGGKEYPYIALYPGGSGYVRKRFNTNLRTVTHIKELRMVLTTTVQVVWFTSEQRIYNDSKGNPLVYSSDPLYNVYEDYGSKPVVDPLGYIDHAMVYHEFDRSLAVASPYSDLIETYIIGLFLEKRLSPYYQANIKLTKEITDMVDISFYANNVTNYRPILKVKGVINTYDQVNSPLYFGAELKLKF